MTSALQMVQMIRDGETTSVALVTAALDRIAETDDALKAWIWLDRDGALAQAQAMDQLRQSGRALRGASWGADWSKGHYRHCRYANRMWQRCTCRSPA